MFRRTTDGDCLVAFCGLFSCCRDSSSQPVYQAAAPVTQSFDYQPIQQAPVYPHHQRQSVQQYQQYTPPNAVFSGGDAVTASTSSAPVLEPVTLTRSR